MALRRYEDWPKRLDAFLKKAASLSFVWGVSDCCLVVADGVLEIAGYDIAAWFRGRYDDAPGALRRLREFGGGALPETMARIASEATMEEVGARYAQAGDIVLLPAAPDYEAFGGLLGLSIGQRSMAMGSAGIVLLPTLDALTAWRV